MVGVFVVESKDVTLLFALASQCLLISSSFINDLPKSLLVWFNLRVSVNKLSSYSDASAGYSGGV